MKPFMEMLPQHGASDRAVGGFHAGVIVRRTLVEPSDGRQIGPDQGILQINQVRIGFRIVGAKIRMPLTQALGFVSGAR